MILHACFLLPPPPAPRGEDLKEGEEGGKCAALTAFPPLPLPYHSRGKEGRKRIHHFFPLSFCSCTRKRMWWVSLFPPPHSPGEKRKRKREEGGGNSTSLHSSGWGKKERKGGPNSPQTSDVGGGKRKKGGGKGRGGGSSIFLPYLNYRGTYGRKRKEKEKKGDPLPLFLRKEKRKKKIPLLGSWNGEKRKEVPKPLSCIPTTRVLKNGGEKKGERNGYSSFLKRWKKGGGGE